MTYKETCDWLDMFWNDQGMLYCWGCGQGGAIEHHHMISRQEMAKIGRPELLTDKKNIIPLCNKCHGTWHRGSLDNKMNLLCFEFMMDYYEREHTQLFELLTYKIETHAKKT